jgi:Na+/proline symporter
MWEIKRPRTTTLGKIGGFVTGIMVTLLSWLGWCAKGREYVLGVIAGIALILLTLFSKVSDTKRQG